VETRFHASSVVKDGEDRISKRPWILVPSTDSDSAGHWQKKVLPRLNIALARKAWAQLFMQEADKEKSWSGQVWRWLRKVLPHLCAVSWILHLLKTPLKVHKLHWTLNKYKYPEVCDRSMAHASFSFQQLSSTFYLRPLHCLRALHLTKENTYVKSERYLYTLLCLSRVSLVRRSSPSITLTC